MNTEDIANLLKDDKKNIALVYAFNSTGKTRLSVEYKNITKDSNGTHTGVYYNAFSEDLFVWDNDHTDGPMLEVIESTLNKFHSKLTEELINEKLSRYKPRFDFTFKFYSNPEDGIESIHFLSRDDKEADFIKISRSEERIFIWCFFLALFEVEGFTDIQSEHFFIDDPVSSLDEHNIFITASLIYELIENHFENKKIIITTHHIGIYSILYNMLVKGEEKEKFTKNLSSYILSREGLELNLSNHKKDIFLYHLHLLDVLTKAKESNDLYTYHFVLLRQFLENIASFLGSGRFSYVLEQIGIDNAAKRASIVNILSHKNIYSFDSPTLVPDNKAMLLEIIEKAQQKYSFLI